MLDNLLFSKTELNLDFIAENIALTFLIILIILCAALKKMPWNLWDIFRGLLCGTNNSNKGQEDDIYRKMDGGMNFRSTGKTLQDIPTTKSSRGRAEYIQKNYNLPSSSASQTGSRSSSAGSYRPPHNVPYSKTVGPVRAFQPHRYHSYNQVWSKSIPLTSAKRTVEQIKDYGLNPPYDRSKHSWQILPQSPDQTKLKILLSQRTSSKQAPKQYYQDTETQSTTISHQKANKRSHIQLDSPRKIVHKNRSSSVHSHNVSSDQLEYLTSLAKGKKDSQMTQMVSLCSKTPANDSSTAGIDEETARTLEYEELHELTGVNLSKAFVTPCSSFVQLQQDTMLNENTKIALKGKDQITTQNQANMSHPQKNNSKDYQEPSIHFPRKGDTNEVVQDSSDIHIGTSHSNLKSGPVEQIEVTKAFSETSFDVTSSNVHGEEPIVIKGKMKNQVKLSRQDVKDVSVKETKNDIDSGGDALRSSEKNQTIEVAGGQSEKMSSLGPHTKGNMMIENKLEASLTKKEVYNSNIAAASPTSQPKDIQSSDGPGVNNQAETNELRMNYLKTEYHCRHEKGLDIYRPLLDHRNYNARVHIGKANYANKEKVLLLVGETGSGKTTWINGLFNYIHGMNWSDDYRVKLIEESRPDHRQNQARSQTKEVTPYTINYQPWFRVPFAVTVIDTPGFGDTGGIQRDEEIIEQIRTFFTATGKDGIDHLDAIGFVIQSSLARLTPSQNYVFNSILSLFGKDVADNIFLLVTFADGQKPQVISGINEAKFPYNSLFKFNNSALYVCSKENTEDTDEYEGNRRVDRMFWRMGTANYKKFMTIMETIRSKSLTLTEEVMRERHCLEVMMDAIQENIKITLTKLEQLKTEKNILKKYEADIERNKNFEYQTYEHVICTRKLNKGEFATNCSHCQKTCHPKCAIPDKYKHQCVAIENRHCKICPHKCHWKYHHIEPFVYELHIEKVTRTTEDLKKRYQDATGRKLTTEQIIKECKFDLEELKMEAVLLAEGARKCLERLSEIALKPNPLSTTDYIDLMIQEEEFLAGPDWKKSVKQLQYVKEKATIMQILQDQQRNIPDAQVLHSQRRRQTGLSIANTIYLNLRKSSP